MEKNKHKLTIWLSDRGRYINLKLGWSWVPFRWTTFSKKSHCKWRSTNYTNTFAFQVRKQILQSWVIDAIVTIWEDRIHCSRWDPIKNVGKNSQWKTSDTNETNLSRFFQSLEGRDCLVHNLFGKGKDEPRETKWTCHCSLLNNNMIYAEKTRNWSHKKAHLYISHI